MQLKHSLLPVVLVMAPVAILAQRSATGASTITEASVRGHMEFLASDAMQGRGSGTEDEWRAATYIGSNLRRWGIEPLGDDNGYVKVVDTGRATAAVAPLLVVGDRTFTHGREMIVQSVNKGAVKGPLFRYTPGARVPDGAFVFVPDGAAVDNAALAGAAGLLTVETPQVRNQWAASGVRMPGVAAGGGRGGRSGGTPPPAVVTIVLDKATHALVGGMADGTPVDFRCMLRPGRTYNAIGKLTGSDPARAAEVILLTAHLDHIGNGATGGRCTPIGEDTICNGADDDASGTTAVLELAEAIAKGPRPKRTVIFAWFGSEEAGGGGNRDFLQHSPVPIQQIVANLEFEMIGRADPAVAKDTLWLTGYERSNLGAELARQGAKLVQDPHPDQNFFQRSDNYALAVEGIIAHTVSSFNLHKEYHTAADDLAHIDFANMTMAIQSMLAPVEWLANATFKPTWYENCQPVRRVPGQAAPADQKPCKANGK